MLDRTSPEMFIAVKRLLYSEVNNHPVIQWFSKHYRPFADTEQRRFLLFICRGGRLDHLFRAREQPGIGFGMFHPLSGELLLPQRVTTKDENDCPPFS